MAKTDQKVLTEGVTLDAVFPTLDWFAADCSFFTLVLITGEEWSISFETIHMQVSGYKKVWLTGGVLIS